MTSALPSGTVTLLFTDIQGSTQLLHELGDRYGEVLAAHRRVLRDAFTAYGGVEVDTQGDAFFVAFGSAADAVAAAAAAQASLAGGPVRVRMGLHTGEPIVTAEGYVGMDVHRGARIMSAGHGGQVLLSETTQRLLDGSSELRDLGEHRLKDLSAPLRLYQLGAGEFPPLRTLYRTNLPVQATPLVGRERELRETAELLAEHRLLTLTGPGGSGKTRLALQLGAELIEHFPDGVYWVPLQALRESALVERSVAGSLGAEEDVSQFIGSKRLLLLLDNFEQIIDAAPTVSALLAATPNAKIVVTSREPLLVDSEQRYPVDPLPLDDASALFVERARAVAPSFSPTPAVGDICRLLDGLPLAIELAAARVVLLDVDDLLVRLDQRLPLLTSRSRDAPARQQTLRATIEWSYELLDPEEVELFRRLAVFRGSFTLEAVEAVCQADLVVLELLLLKSLVRRWGSRRLGLLDTIREFAEERLEESPEAEDVRRRCAEYYLAVAESTNLSAGRLRPGGQRLDLAMLEHDNFRGALAWTVRSGNVDLGLQIATALEQLWVADDPPEGVRWFERLLGRPEAADVSPVTRAHALRAFGSSVHIAGDSRRAQLLFEESLAHFDRLGDEKGRAVLLHRLGISALHAGLLDRALELVEESDVIHRRNDDVWGQAQTIGTLGAIARDSGHDARAVELIARSAELAVEAGVPWWQGGMLAELAALSVKAARFEDAERNARESLAIAADLRDRAGRVFGVGLLASCAAGVGHAERAGRLWGAIEDEDAHAPLGGWRRHREACATLVEGARGPAFERGLDEGRRLTLDEAVAFALDRPAPA